MTNSLSHSERADEAGFAILKSVKDRVLRLSTGNAGVSYSHLKQSKIYFLVTNGGSGMPHTESQHVVVDGATLRCDTLAAVARRRVPVTAAPEGLARAAAAYRAALDAVGTHAFYGRTTGVGANHQVAVQPGNGHGLRLLRSHAGGAGEPVAADVARGALAIRLNQLAAGGSGADPAWIEALAAALNAGLTPEFPVLGAIGTGDLTGLATTALALIGERPWRGAAGPVRRALLAPAVADADALAFLSSNAVTLAQATLAHQDLTALLEAELRIAAFSHLALSGSAQPYAEPVQAARPHPGQRRTARRLRELLGPDAARPGARVQDPYGLRALPQVHGPAVDALAQVERVLRTELNAAAENPLIDVPGGQVLHNGNFHGAYLALALDCGRLALCADAALSPARLAALTDPERTACGRSWPTAPRAARGSWSLSTRQAPRWPSYGSWPPRPRSAPPCCRAAPRSTPPSHPKRPGRRPAWCQGCAPCSPASWWPPSGRCASAASSRRDRSCARCTGSAATACPATRRTTHLTPTSPPPSSSSTPGELAESAAALTAVLRRCLIQRAPTEPAGNLKLALVT